MEAGKIGDGGGWEPLEPGDVARFEGLEVEFKMLAIKLLALHNMARHIAETQDTATAVEQLSELRPEIYKTLVDPFSPDGGNPNLIFSFIMYLIDMISIAQQRDTEMSGKVAEAANMLNEICDRLGLQLEDSDETSGGETFTTGVGQLLTNVHRREDCDGDWCVIHNPIGGPWNDWPTVWRGDNPFGLDIWRGFERQCPHGVGHTAMEEVLRGDQKPHGCDGCPCSPGTGATPVYDDQGVLRGYQ